MAVFVEQSYEEAAKWFSLAAKQGDEEAQKALDSLPKKNDQ